MQGGQNTTQETELRSILIGYFDNHHSEQWAGKVLACECHTCYLVREAAGIKDENLRASIGNIPERAIHGLIDLYYGNHNSHEPSGCNCTLCDRKRKLDKLPKEVKDDPANEELPHKRSGA